MRELSDGEIEELFRLYVIRVDMLPPLTERKAASERFHNLLHELHQQCAPDTCFDSFRYHAIRKMLELRKRQGGPDFPTMPKK